MPPRAPLQVEVVTKIPVRTGLGLTDPGITGGITRTAAAQTAAQRAAVEVVTDVPGVLRNITPVTFGQRLSNLRTGIATAGIAGSKLITGIGTGLLGALAEELINPAAKLDPSSDRYGGLPYSQGIGEEIRERNRGAVTNSQAKPKPQPKPQTQTQTQPKSQTQPKPQPQPQTQAQTQPKSQPKPQAQTKPQPKLQAQTQPRRPLSVIVPEPRASLQTPSPDRPQPVSKDSPYPLNFVDLNSYGGVNLTYPIAQKLIEFDTRLEEIERQLEKIPQTVDTTLRNAKIETIVTLPVNVDLISQLPVKADLTSQLPVNVDLASQLPVTTNLISQLPLNVDFASGIPVNIDLRKEIPVEFGLTSQLPLAIDLIKQVPVLVDLRKEIPLNFDLSSKLPLNFDLISQLPVNIDLRKEVPVNLDLSTILQPDDAASGLKTLRECCESIQNTLKKKEEIFEGMGSLMCDNQTIPYSYRGAGLNGIHQLIKIILDANEQILEKICTLDAAPDPLLIQGSGVYECGSLPPIIYNYSGLGLLGIQNQIDQLFNLDKQILTEVCDIGSSPLPLSFPEISGQVEYFDCDGSTQAILYSGNGLQGLNKQIEALTNVVKVGVKAACDSSAVVVMPDARFEQFNPTGQLQITLGTHYPTQNGSLWHIYLPNPIDTLNWCDHFDRLTMTKGNIYARLEWANSKIPTGAYFETEEEAYLVLRYLALLSDATPTLNEAGQPKVLIQKGNSSKRNIPVRTIRAVRAAASQFGADGEVANVKCYVPPSEGCSAPTII